MRVIKAEIKKDGSGGTYSKSFYSKSWENELRTWVKRVSGDRDMNGFKLCLYRSKFDGSCFVYTGSTPGRTISL